MCFHVRRGPDGVTFRLYTGPDRRTRLGRDPVISRCDLGISTLMTAGSTETPYLNTMATVDTRTSSWQPGYMAEINATSAAMLGLLHAGPATGGELVASAEATFGAFFSVTRSQVYRELPVLAEAGLVRPGKQGPRSSQQYVISAAGKKAFKQWVNEEAGPDHIRSTLLLRVINSATVTAKQRSELIETARSRYKAEAAAARETSKETDDPIDKAIAEFGHAYARAALRLVEAVDNA